MTEQEIFEESQRAADLKADGDEPGAREIILRLLDRLEDSETKSTPMVDAVLRDLGLYSYMRSASDLNAFLLRKAFAVALPENEVIFHRDQARMFRELLQGNLVVSAPTSFGKSFVIDAYIATVKPKTVMIIVPTIALTDEVRRRLTRRFGSFYKIITNAGEKLEERSILVFPQERALQYVDEVGQIDFLVVDEFYKADPDFHDERAATLMLSIARFLPRTKRYFFLAPNIERFSAGRLNLGKVTFRRYTESTVVQELHECWRNLPGTAIAKRDCLLNVLGACLGQKTLVYVSSHSQVADVSDIFLNDSRAGRLTLENDLCGDFADWLRENVSENSSWRMPSLIERCIGVHSGRVNRMIAQMILRLFELPRGIGLIVSTSSIIEGVNTSARNVILWSVKNGQSYIDEFTLKNVYGRAGRMFRHFVGHVYVLEKPKPKEKQLELALGVRDVDAIRFCDDAVSQVLSEEQKNKVNEFRSLIVAELGMDFWREVFGRNCLQSLSKDSAVRIAKEIRANRNVILGLAPLQTGTVVAWEGALFSLLSLLKIATPVKYGEYVRFVLASASGWRVPLKEKIARASPAGDVEVYFDAERHMTYEFASCVRDLCVIVSALHIEANVDLSQFAEGLSHAFLPRVVYQLEEYGLPRMLSIRMHERNIMDFETEELSLDGAIEFFMRSSPDEVLAACGTLPFDREVLTAFYEGLPRQRPLMNT